MKIVFLLDLIMSFKDNFKLLSNKKLEILESKD